MKFFTYAHRVIPEVESSIYLSKNFLENLGVIFNVLVNDNELFHLIKKCDGSEVSTKPFFESDPPWFWIRPSLFWLRPSIFRVRPSYFSSQSFSLFQSVLSNFPSQTPFFRDSPSPNQFFSFFESDLPIFSVQSIPLFQVSLSHFSTQNLHFYGSVLPTFQSQSFLIFEPDLPIFLGQTFSFFESGLPIFFGQSFPLSQVKPSNFSIQI